MTSHRSRRKKLMSDINVVPYIDVMLVLLIIFMVTAPLVTQGVKVELPQAPSQVVETNDEPFVITVSREGQYFVNLGDDRDKPIDLQTVTAKIIAVRNTKPDVPVLIKGDRGVAYERVVRLLAGLSGAGVSGVGLLTEPAEG
jgi:biopolymer transport protein TolR